MSTNHRVAAWGCAGLASVLLAAATLFSATRADAQGVPQRSLDDELLKELGGDLLDELDSRKQPDGEDEPVPANDQSETERPAAALRRQLGAAAVTDSDQPLVAVGETMREVQSQLRQGDLGPGTQQRVREIVDRLDEMIAQMRQRRQSGGSSTAQQVASRQEVTQPRQQTEPDRRPPSPNQPKPAQTSDAKPGQATGKAADMQQMRAVLRELWGRLPERARQQMLELPVEEFLPQYEAMIEEYFRRLAEEKGND